MKSKGQGLGIQILVVVIFTALLLLLFMAFLYPETSEQMINNIFETLQGLEWKEIIMFSLFVILIFGVAIFLVLIHSTKLFEEREV